MAAADFVQCTDAELDQYAIDSRTGKPASDQRPAPPTRFEDWEARVRRQTAIWSLVYGREWRGVKEHALELLCRWHSEAPHRWPLQVLIDVWEELHWRFIEELKTELRKIKTLAGRESLTLTDLKFYALMPDEHGQPPLQLPRTFDLEHPEGWFATEVLPRIDRKQERILWKMTWEGAGKTRSGAQNAGGGEPSRAGGDEKLSVKSLLGPKLTPEETSRAKDRAPVDRESKLLCWGYISHLGCGQTNCQRAHEHLRGSFEALDPAVRMQLLRRGGLKRMRQETKETATEKIKELRSQVAKDKDSKIKDGQDRRKTGQTHGPTTTRESRKEPPTEEAKPENPGKAGGVTWRVPEEMVEVDYTAQEEEFAKLVKGPDASLYRHEEKPSEEAEGRGGETAPQDAKDLLREAQRLAEGPVLKALQDASDDLYSWAATRVANDPSLTLTALLDDMVQYGLGELAEEAAGILEQHGDYQKAGSARRCQIGET